MSKSKIEKRLPEPQHSKEQKADATTVRPAIAKPTVVRSPNILSTEKDEDKIGSGKNQHGRFVLDKDGEVIGVEMVTLPVTNNVFIPTDNKAG